MKALFLMALLCLSLTSCFTEKEDILQSRSTQNMMVKITKTDQSTVNLQCSNVQMDYFNSSQFTVVTNPGTQGSQTFNAISARIDDTDGDLKIYAQGSQQFTYINKNSATISIGNGCLSASINPGTHVGVGTSIIGEEEDNN